MRDLKIVLEYSFFTALSALKINFLFLEIILIAVVLPEEMEPVRPILIILI